MYQTPLLVLFFSSAFWEILRWYCNLQCDAKSNELQRKKERRTSEELSPETGPGVGSTVTIWKPWFSYLQVCLISRTLCSDTHACMRVCVCGGVRVCELWSHWLYCLSSPAHLTSGAGFTERRKLFPVACRNVSDSRTTALFFIWACGSFSEVRQLTAN